MFSDAGDTGKLRGRGLFGSVNYATGAVSLTYKAARGPKALPAVLYESIHRVAQADLETQTQPRFYDVDAADRPIGFLNQVKYLFLRMGKRGAPFLRPIAKVHFPDPNNDPNECVRLLRLLGNELGRAKAGLQLAVHTDTEVAARKAAIRECAEPIRNQPNYIEKTCKCLTERRTPMLASWLARVEKGVRIGSTDWLSAYRYSALTATIQRYISSTLNE